MQGWVKFERNTLDNPVIFKDTEHLAVWLYLLVNAAYKDTKAAFGGKIIDLKPGQLLTSRNIIAGALKINHQKIWRILLLFKNEQLIEQATDRHRTLITIKDASFIENVYVQQNEQRMYNHCTTEQENEKEEKKSSKRKEGKDKELSNKDRIYNPCGPLYGSTLTTEKATQKTDYFEEFWAEYPKKVGKAYAKRCFLKLNPTRETTDRMLSAIKEQRQSREWQRDMGQYIPNPSTWLNQGRWEDQLSDSIYYKKDSSDSCQSANGSYTEEEKRLMLEELFKD